MVSLALFELRYIELSRWCWVLVFSFERAEKGGIRRFHPRPTGGFWVVWHVFSAKNWHHASVIGHLAGPCSAPWGTG